MRMTTRSTGLADKLVSEGDKVLAYFGQLLPESRSKPVYGEGAGWKVRDVFEHLILSEESLQLLFEQVAREGRGVDEGYDIDAFNAAHTGGLAMLSWDELLTRYTGTRARTASFTRGLNDEQLAIRARHPALGDASLEDMIKLIYVHHSMHMRDVRRSI